MDDELYLISCRYTQDPMGQQVPETVKAQVWARIDSISQGEFYAAGSAGLRPELRATVNSLDYEGQDMVEYAGILYGVYRTFKRRDDQVELYLERKAGLRQAGPKGGNHEQ